MRECARMHSEQVAGLFTSVELPEAWIKENRLSGVLTLYPVDVGVYEWAIEQALFSPRKPHESEPPFIGGFTSASQPHYHYEDGHCALGPGRAAEGCASVALIPEQMERLSQWRSSPVLRPMADLDVSASQ